MKKYIVGFCLMLLCTTYVRVDAVVKSQVEKNVGVVVDGFSTGKALVDIIKAYGYSCIHVLSSSDIHQIYGESNPLEDDRYAKILIFSDKKQIIRSIASYNIKFIIPGSESGVTIADELANALNVFANSYKNISARRDKFLMTKAVKEYGLKTVQFFKSDDLQKIKRWISIVRSWPIVLKPLDSGGGDNVHFCHNIQEVEMAFDKIKNSLNVFGKPNSEVLAQTFAKGQEYMMNLVCCNEDPYVTDIWRVNKVKAVYDNFEMVYEEDQAFDALKKYGIGVCKALGINYGAAHIEVKVDDQGPTFIECGARIMGSADLSFQTEINGYNQLTAIVESYLDPDFHGYSKLLDIFFVIFFNFVFLNSVASTNTQQNA